MKRVVIRIVLALIIIAISFFFKAAKISQAEYEQINIGMSYEQVKDIAGGKGELIEEKGEKGSKEHYILYGWRYASDKNKAVGVMFINGKVIYKTIQGKK